MGYAMTEQQKPTKKDEDELDEALEESFPASDPPAPVREPTRDEGEKIEGDEKQSSGK
jgi:hypothetical protein